jgi:hypothetical protein
VLRWLGLLQLTHESGDSALRRVRPGKVNFGNASIGEQLEAADLVDLGLLSQITEHAIHSIRNDQRSGPRIEVFGALEYANLLTGTRQQVRGKQSSGGSSYNSNFTIQSSGSLRLNRLAARTIFLMDTRFLSLIGQFLEHDHSCQSTQHQDDAEYERPL